MSISINIIYSFIILSIDATFTKMQSFSILSLDHCIYHATVILACCLLKLMIDLLILIVKIMMIAQIFIAHSDEFWIKAIHEFFAWIQSMHDWCYENFLFIAHL